MYRAYSLRLYRNNKDDAMFDDEHVDIKRDGKRCVSVRIDLIDSGKMKNIARRLRTRESEVFRFLIKLSLSRLALLHDHNVTGKALMPLIADCGPELAYHFKLSPERLQTLINEGVCHPDDRVDNEDIDLLALTALPQHHLSRKLRELVDAATTSDDIIEGLRRYLADKYTPLERPAQGPANA